MTGFGTSTALTGVNVPEIKKQTAEKPTARWDKLLTANLPNQGY
jgi:hypothetical protein